MPLHERPYGWQMRFLRGGGNFSQSLAHDIDLSAYVKYLEIRTEGSRHVREDLRNALFNLIEESLCDSSMSLLHWSSNGSKSFSFPWLTNVKIKELSNAITTAVSHTWRINPRWLNRTETVPASETSGDRTVAQEAADEVEKVARLLMIIMTNTDAPDWPCPSSRVWIRRTVVPVVVHRAQNIREYSATDHSSRTISRNHDSQ